MSYIETLVAVAVFAIFIVLASQLVGPLAITLSTAHAEYERAKSFVFLDKSFRNECAKASPDIDSWSRDVRAVSGLESCEVVPVLHEGVPCAMKAICVIGESTIEILAEAGI